MNEDLRRRYVRDLVTDLEQVGGSRFEQWIKPLWDDIAGAPVQARGLNLEGMPVRGEFDARWPDGSGSEASSDQRYFQPPYEKAKNDVGHVRTVAPELRTIRLFCTRVAPTGAPGRLRKAVRECYGEGFELDVWDGRRIAEYIVDKLLRDERYVDRVGNALPNLWQIAERNAATGLVPRQSSVYGGRDSEESELKRRLTTSKCIVLCGMSGIGKTQVAVAVANELRNRFHMVMWVTATDIKSVLELKSVDVRNNGYRHNVWGMLKLDRVLLILDDVTVDLDLDELAADCDKSRVIVTSQTAFGGNPLEIGFVDGEHAGRILSSGLGDSCPERIVSRAMELFGGHPLLMELLNRQALADGHWETVEQEFQHLLGGTTENRETAAKRLLVRHLSAVGPELSFFFWCGHTSVDAGLFRERFGTGGVRKLADRAMTVPAQDDVVKVHQLVLSAAERLSDEGTLQVDETGFGSGLVDYITQTGHPRGLQFYRVVHRHRDLIRRLLQETPHPGALRYAYFHGQRLAELLPALVGVPESDVNTVLANGCETMAVLSLMEAIELDYGMKRERDRSSAGVALERRLPLYEQIADGTADGGIRDIVRHHRAKTLLKLRRREEALEEFRALQDSVEVRFQARLQIARASRDDPEGALEIIASIVEAEQQSPGAVATSVLLEAFATLRLGFLRECAREFEQGHRGYMAQQIKAAACSGESQPMQTFAAVGADWAFADEALFIDVMEVIDVGIPEDAEDDRNRVAIGRVLAAAGKMYLRLERTTEGKTRLEDAVRFYHAIRRPQAFASTHHADALIQLERFDEAVDVLEAVPEAERESYWRLRRSEAHRAKKEHQKALTCLDVALEDGKLGGRRATFLELRAGVLFDMRDLGFRDWFRRAIEASDSEKNTARLRRRLEAMERKAAGW